MKIIIACVLILLVSPVPVFAEQSERGFDVRYLQVMLGRLQADEVWTITDDNGNDSSADRDDLIYGGVTAQLSSSNGIFQYGLETGGLISFINDTSVFARSNSDGGTAIVEVDNELWMIDLSIGAFVSVRPWPWVRIYASAGPSLMIGSMAIEAEDDVTVQPVSNNGSTITFEPDERETTTDVSVYGRAGVDFILENNFIVGFSARKIDSELDFDSAGVIALDDTQVFITFGQAF